MGRSGCTQAKGRREGKELQPSKLTFFLSDHLATEYFFGSPVKMFSCQNMQIS